MWGHGRRTPTLWSQGVKEWKIWGHGQPLPGNAPLWSQGVKECKIWGHGQQHRQPLKIWGHGQQHCQLKIWGHGQQHCQALKVPVHPIKWPAPWALGAHLHLQVPPRVHLAHGNRLWHQSLQTHWALGAMQHRQALLLRRIGMQRQHLVR